MRKAKVSLVLFRGVGAAAALLRAFYCYVLDEYLKAQASYVGIPVMIP